jgi:hypothetical protein
VNLNGLILLLFGRRAISGIGSAASALSTSC